MSKRSLRSFIPLPLLMPFMSFIIGFETGGFQLVLRGMSSDFAVTALGSGILAAAQYAGFIVSPFVFGSLSDKIGKKRVIIISGSLAALGCAVSAVSHSMAPFIIGSFFTGSGYSAVESAEAAALSDMYGEKSSHYLCIAEFLFSVGAIVAPLVTEAGISGGLWNWRFVFTFCGAVFAVISCLYAAARIVVPVSSRPSAREKMPVWRYFASAAFAFLFVSIFFECGLEQGFSYFIESHFSKTLLRPDLSAYSVSAYWVGMASFRLLYSVVRVKPYRALLSGLAVACAALLGMAVSNSAYVSLAMCVLTGMALGPLWAMLIDLAAKQFPENSGGAVGLFSSGCGIGGAVFPIITGLLSDGAGLRTAFAVLAAVAAAAWCLSLAAYRINNRKARERS